MKKRQNTSNQGNNVIQQRFGQLTRQPLWVTCPWAGQSHLSSSAQWERGLLERHSGTSHSPLPAPPHFWAASQRWDALEGRTITNTIIIIQYTQLLSLCCRWYSHILHRDQNCFYDKMIHFKKTQDVTLSM